MSAFFLHSFSTFTLRRVSRWTWSSPSWAPLASEPCGASCLQLPSTEIAHVSCPAWLLCVSSGRWSLDLSLVPSHWFYLLNSFRRNWLDYKLEPIRLNFAYISSKNSFFFLTLLVVCCHPHPTPLRIVNYSMRILFNTFCEALIIVIKLKGRLLCLEQLKN